MLYCPNPTCQAPNPDDQKFCQKCSTILLRRYLWGLGEAAAAYQPGDLIADRYLCQQSHVFLDTKPGQLSSTYQELPDSFLAYLRLVAYPLHVPQVYDWIPSYGTVPDLLLLDHVPLYAPGLIAQPSQASQPEDSEVAIQLLPMLTSQWQNASPARQLNWLWQIAGLWQPLSSERAAVSLLDPEIMRVEGSLLRLLELRLEKEQPTLVDLGYFWLSWLKTAHPAIAEFLEKLCQGLIQGEIHNSELLVGYLDGALLQLSQAQTRQIQMATLSDQGPTRQRNEDACYPVSGAQPPMDNKGLLIVCDGIGGHQGGDVASQLAIATLEQRVNVLDIDRLDPTSLSIELEKTVCSANDAISQRNDSEHRFDRQRMGTTVVMALVRDHELYITHVGDSRAYWITRWGCHQITLDDDVASREVRLGYSFYRQALHQPSAGSLVQALGMGASSMLYPTVQRLIPDEDSIFLLCSDGLSDNDRIEESWESAILPLFDGNVNLATINQQLVEIANTRNGYDNVTVGLIHYRVALDQPVPTLTELPSLQLPITAKPAPATPSIAETVQPTELIAPADGTAPEASLSPDLVSSDAPKTNLLPLVIGMGVLVGMTGLLIALLLPSLRASRLDPNPPTPSPNSPASSESPNSTRPELVPLSSLEVGTTILLNRSPQIIDDVAQPPVLISRPEQNVQQNNGTAGAPASPAPSSPAPTTAITTVGLIPIGTVLQVLSKQSLSQEESWVKLRVCSTAAGDSPEASILTPSPSTAVGSPLLQADPLSQPALTSSLSPSPSPIPLLQVGQAGWIREAELLPQVTLKTTLTQQQQYSCS